jgi:integrase/recombinase XerD
MKVAGHGQAKVLSTSEARDLFEAMSDRDRALFGICLFTGCRINEACTLLSGDVFDAAGRVRARLTIRRENTKGKQETRQITTHPTLRGYLEAYALDRGKTYLFPGRHGRGHINPRSADAILREVCDRLEMEGISTHSFRRTALTMMSGAGVPLRVIQEISGHRSLAALQRYLEVSEKQVEAAVGAIGF